MDFWEKLERLLKIPDCRNPKYKREQTSKEIREEIIREYDGKCWLCNCNPSTINIHHVDPEGLSTKENLVPLCSFCHRWIHWILYKIKGYRRMMQGGWY